MHWIDWYGEHWLVVPLVLLGLAFVLVRTALWTRRRLERGRRKRVARKAAKAEESALTLLEKHGYEVLETQVEQQWEVDYGSDNLAVQLRVDATVRRDGRDFIAEVKSGQLVASLRHAPTRRQLLEYRVALPVDGVLQSDDGVTAALQDEATVKEILGIEVIGVVPESPDVLAASNAGTPVILNADSDVARAYEDAVSRLLGDSLPMRFVDEPKKGILARLFGS